MIVETVDWLGRKRFGVGIKYFQELQQRICADKGYTLKIKRVDITGTNTLQPLV